MDSGSGREFVLQPHSTFAAYLDTDEKAMFGVAEPLGIDYATSEVDS